MSRFRIIALALVTMCVPGLVAVAGPVAAAEPRHTVTTLHFKVVVGPAGAEQTCDIVGDLYVPRDASPGKRMPAVLSTNGFGGSKDDQAGLSKLFADNGYVALSYSGLGFGGSGCEIALDDPDYDGRAAAQLIDYLGGKVGIAFSDAAHTQPVTPLDKVTLDRPGDPRVGMFGGSYGGQVQYAAAAVTPKLDTIVPIITWNDLSYSLSPNNTDQVTLEGQEQTGVSTDTPGSVKTNWALAFSALGATSDAQNQQLDPISSRCPNFVDFVCPALVNGAATGALDDDSVQHLRHASVASYQDKVKVPTLILQGQADTLFNLNEAIATYEALQAQGTEVKMSWLEYGHSGDPAPGEIDFDAPNPSTQHITKRIFDWFAHYLQRKRTAPTGPEFSYFRDWVGYRGNARQAYQDETSYPVGKLTSYHLSSSSASTITGGDLVTDRGDVTTGSQSFVAPPGPASAGEDLDVVSMFFEQPEEIEPLKEVPGTSAHYDTEVLPTNVDVVGSPRVRLQVEALTAGGTQSQDLGKLVLYLKVSDVAPGPNGAARVVRNLAAPVRVPDTGEPFTVTMPAFAHRFEKGHRIRLVVAGASPNYRGGNLPADVTVATTAGPASRAAAAALPAQSLTLPTLDEVPASSGPDDPNGPGTAPGVPAAPDDGQASAPGNGPGTGTGTGTGGQGGAGNQAQAAPAAAASYSTPLPDTGGPSLGLLGAGLLLVVLGAQLLVRRRRLGVS